MARLGRAQPFQPHFRNYTMRGTISWSKTFSDGLIGTDSVASLIIKLISVTEGLIGTDVIAKYLQRTITEGLIGTDTALKFLTRLFTEGLIGTDTLSNVVTFVLTLLEGLIGLDHYLINGSDVVWGFVTKSTSAVWTKVSQSATSTWTHIIKD